MEKMYKFSDNQISFSDFGQPVGMTMNPNNRWVKKAEQIPWAEIEKRYYTPWGCENIECGHTRIACR